MKRQKRIAIVIADQFSLFGYAVASEVFRFANEELGEQIYSTTAVSKDPGLVRSSNGTEVNAQVRFETLSELDAIILCSGKRNDQNAIYPELLNWLRDQHRHGTPIFALASAVWVTASTGLLEGNFCAAHWTEISALRHTFPNIKFTKRTFTTSNRVWVCSGGDSVTDMFLYFLSQNHGLEFSTKLRRMIILKPNLGHVDPGDSLFHSNASDKELAGERFLALIESAIETPLTIVEICKRLSISQRTLNRYCHDLFGHSAKDTYVNARLQHAKNLLSGTSLAVSEIATYCGFKTPAHFSQVFATRFGETPSCCRRASIGQN